jgi:hypothetical protein
VTKRDAILPFLLVVELAAFPIDLYAVGFRRIGHGRRKSGALSVTWMSRSWVPWSEGMGM